MTEDPRLGGDLPTLKEILEALFFASDEPLTPAQIHEILAELEQGDRPGAISEEHILKAIEDLNREFEETRRAFRIVKIAGGYQFATLSKFAHWLGRMVQEKSKRKLSQAALESLAVIAYKQPVTKPEIEAIRGVNADYVLHSLLEKNLVTIVGRAATPGRPLLYGTTREFLKHFGLNDLSELPKPREIDELLAESEFEVEKRMLAEREALSDEEGTDTTAGNPPQGNIVIGEDGTLRRIDEDTDPEAGDLSPEPE